MPLIAPHHRPDHPLYALRESSNAHTPVCAWPDDCMVQWGARGVVLSRTPGKRPYETAFFEVFPQDPKTFVRGEGATIEDAERAAFAKFQRHKACGAHEFERRGYRNGAGICKHCGLFASDVFEPTTRCCVCDTPTYWTFGRDEQGVEHWFCKDHEAERKARGLKSPLDFLEADG